MANPLTLLQALILGYFALVNVFYALSLWIASRELGLSLRQAEEAAFSDRHKREFYKPISILVPAFNEEATIVASLRSFLTLHYFEHEVIVISDGSSDGTVEALKHHYSLQPATLFGCKTVPTAPIRAVYRSATYPNLLVVDKENGGKADALNAGLIYARYPLFCAVDADSLLDAQALLRASRKFVEDDTLLATGGTVRPLNNALVSPEGEISLRAPRSWLERFQIIEYTRVFLTGRTTFSAARMLLVISGAFGLFRRDVVQETGGYATGTVGEDMELVMRLHRWAKERREPYHISYTVDPICWTQVPEDWGTLLRQRNRWQRGLLETLWRHRAMFLNPRYGRIGLVATPFYWLFEAIAPAIELGGYVLFVWLALTGQLELSFVVLFVLLAVLYGALVSVAAFGIEIFMQTRYRLKDRLLLFAASLFENLGYRQVLTLERFFASLQVWRRRGQWGEMKRREIAAKEADATD